MRTPFDKNSKNLNKRTSWSLPQSNIAESEAVAKYLVSKPNSIKNKRAKPKNTKSDKFDLYNKDFLWLDLDKNKYYCNYCRLLCSQKNIVTFPINTRKFIFNGVLGG